MRFGTVAALLITCLLTHFALADEFVKTKPRGPFTLDQLFRRPHIWGAPPTAIKWSADGRLLAYFWKPPGEENIDLFVEDTIDGTRKRLNRSSVFNSLPEEDRKSLKEYLFLSDANRIAFLAGSGLYVAPSDFSGEATPLLRGESMQDLQAPASGGKLSVIRDGNLWTVDVTSGSARRLTWLPTDPTAPSYPRLRTSTRIQRYGWSPDGQYSYILLISTANFRDIIIPDYNGNRDVEPKHWRRGYVGKPIMTAQVGIIDTAGGLRWISFPEDYYFNSETIISGAISWSPDSSKLLVNYIAPDYQDWTIYKVAPKNLNVEVVYKEHQEPWFASMATYWSPDGTSVYITSERSGWKHIYALPAGGGEPRPLTSGRFDVFGFEPPTGDGRLFYTSGAVHPLEGHLFAVLPDGDEIQLSENSGFYTPFPAPDGTKVAVLFSTANDPDDLFLISTEEPGSMKRLTTSPHADFAKVAKPTLRYFTYPNKEDGKLIRGYMLMPPDFNPAKRYPVVLSCVYANLAKNRWIKYNPLDMFMCTELGYIIVRIDIRASIGYGKEFHYGYYQKMGIIDSGECASAADFLRSQPFVDPERIGIWGSSYGGFLTLMTLCTHPKAFTAGVAFKPVTLWENYTDDYTAQRLGRPDQFPDVYRATSPVYHAEGLEAPLLIFHGMLDDNVLFQDTVLMIQAFVEAGKKVDVMFYPQDNHSFTRHPDTLRDIMKRTAAFFETHLGTGPR